MTGGDVFALILIGFFGAAMLTLLAGAIIMMTAKTRNHDRYLAYFFMLVSLPALVTWVLWVLFQFYGLAPLVLVASS